MIIKLNYVDRYSDFHEAIVPVSPLGSVHKRRPQSGERGFVQCGYFSDKGFLQMWTSALFGAKTSYFRNLRCDCTNKWEGGWAKRTFFGQGREGSIFCDFVRTPFMDGPYI